MNGTKVRIIEKYDDFIRLEDQWDELVESNRVNHAFMKHSWFCHWIESFEAANNLHLVTKWSDGQLVAVAPCMRRILRYRGIKTRGISFISSDISPRCNFIVADTDYMEPLFEELLSAKSWDVIFTENLEADLEVTNTYLDYVRTRKKPYQIQADPGLESPYLDTEGTWQEYLDSLTKSMQKRLQRMCLRRLEKSGDWRMNRIRTAAEFERFRLAMFDISANSWKAEGDCHLREDTHMGKMYSSYTPVAVEKELVRLYVLSIKGKPVGFEYLLSGNGRLSLIRCDYDEAYSYYSPGNTLRMLILSELFDDDKVREYDFGGDPYPYKLEWTKKTRKHVTITVGNDNLSGRFVMAAKNLVLPIMRSCRLPAKPDEGHFWNGNAR